MSSTFPTIKHETAAVRRALGKRRIYLASSWRCPTQPEVLSALRAEGHEVYDFRNPAPGNTGFSWRQAGDVSAPGPYMETLKSDVAAHGFRLDKSAMDWADTCVLLLPCGRSAHLEAGFMAGEGKDVFVLLSEDKFEPELMYLLCTAITDNLDDLLRLVSGSHGVDTSAPLPVRETELAPKYALAGPLLDLDGLLGNLVAAVQEHTRAEGDDDLAGVDEVKAIQKHVRRMLRGGIVGAAPDAAVSADGVPVVDGKTDRDEPPIHIPV